MNGWVVAAFLVGWILGAWMGVRGGRRQILAQLKIAVPGITADLMRRMKFGNVTIQVVDVNGDIVAEGSTKPDGSLH